MELLRPTLKQHLSYATCAIALVLSLSAYKSSISASPLSAAQSYREAEAMLASANRLWHRDSHAITPANLGFYSVLGADTRDSQSIQLGENCHNIQTRTSRSLNNSRVITQKTPAKLSAVLKHQFKPLQILSRNLSLFCRSLNPLHFDEIGKVIKNIWHPNPEVTV